MSQEKALNFEPYGLSLSQSLSACAFLGRQSPTGLSLGSDISGNSGEAGQKETNSLKLEGVKKLWGKEGYLPKKESPVGKEDSSKPAVESSVSAEPAVNSSALQSEQGTASPSKEEKEKQHLASTLFVGLGLQGSVSLMGKGESLAQKFKRKSKMGESQNNEELFTRKSPPLSPSPDALSRNKNPFQNNGHLRLRKASLNSSDAPESKAVLDRSRSLPEAGLGETLLGCTFSPPSLFADGNMEVFQPSPDAQPRVKKQLSLTPSLPEEVAQYPHSEITELCGNDSIVLYLCKVWKEDSFTLFAFLANRSVTTLTAVKLELEPSRHFKISGNLGCHFAEIEAQSIESCQKCVAMEELCSEGLLSGSLRYHRESEMCLLFSVTLVLLDFIRPMKITTEEFGKLWLSFSNDVKQNLKMTPSQGSLSVVLNTLQQKLKLHVVDIIGSEGLAACRLLPSVPGLLHCRIHAGMLALWFRSPCSALPDCLLYQCQKIDWGPQPFQACGRLWNSDNRAAEMKQVEGIFYSKDETSRECKKEAQSGLQSPSLSSLHNRHLVREGRLRDMALPSISI
ncbi:AP-4 complex subunit epsilon-1 [Paroedura picta]|uniref:AP-4 complex subunit epsilon-1 n=1 Tax=Paroedura picta TaxID=143630 RepID=UPI0040563FFF